LTKGDSSIKVDCCDKTNALFTVSLELPMELQLKIWKTYIEAEPRRIELFTGDAGPGPSQLPLPNLDANQARYERSDHKDA
jgi:hypothetical protein